MPPPTNN
ncbi:hypothetical protein Tco_0240412, partial [Tanacetum coccineum]